jgi:hypothetical protein
MLEVYSIINQTKQDKALGWAAIPRQIGDEKDQELLEALVNILE